MSTRREFMQIAASVAAMGVGTQALAAQKLTQDQLLAFKATGNVTLLHIADLHAQLLPLYFKEPHINLGVGDANGRVPHLTGQKFLTHYGLKGNTPEAYALTSQNFIALAQNYAQLGGLDRLATLVKAIRAQRPYALLLDGGDTWQNSYTSLKTQGQDMVECMALLKPDAMTGHWEFTLGQARVEAMVKTLGFAFLAQNIRENEFNEEVFAAQKIFVQNGVRIAVIGQALPYTPIANPRHLIPNWSFGLRESEMQKQVDKARASADLVVLLSHNGFDVDVKLAGRVKGIDVILAAHTHDALPKPFQVGKTLIIASGSHGKFLSRLDLDVQKGEVKGYNYKLIPVFSNVITPDTEMKAKIEQVRAPYKDHLKEVVGKTQTLLYRRGNFNGTWDNVICDALIQEREAEISLSPGFRWGASLLPESAITREDVYNATAITYPTAYRQDMSGMRLKEILEDVADNLFNPDPYLQQGGDMVRVGGLSYTIDVTQPIGNRISNLTLLKSGNAIEASKTYKVSGWASVAENVEGPPIWDVVTNYISKAKIIAPQERTQVKVVGA